MYYFIYRIFSYLASPIAPLILRWRIRKGKEETPRLEERLGYAKIPRPEGKLLWFHAASMGETISVLPLIKKIIEQYPDAYILLTTVTVTSAKNAAQRLPNHAFHQFAPIDTPGAIDRFLEHWKPDMAFWVESEFWPNMMLETYKSGCEMFLVNARVSEKSAQRWFRFHSLIRSMLECYSCILAKSDKDAARLKNLGGKNVLVRGNLKFSAPPLESDSKRASNIVSQVGDRPRWLASSTHPGEEAMVAEIHNSLRETFPSLLTLIVPRHADRGDAIAKELSELGLHVVQRSKQEKVTQQTDIYLADTMGELGIFYRLSGIVFIGGSLVEHGGQNPFEPARLDCAILYGPHMYNFSEFCHELESAQGAFKIANTRELATRVEDLLRDHHAQEKIAQNAFQAVKSKEQVIEEVFAALRNYLDVKLDRKKEESSSPKPDNHKDQTVAS